MRALLVLTLVVLGACKKKAPDVVEPDRPSLVDQALQVVMVTPSQVPANTPTPVQVVGDGFVDGAEVRVGEAWVPGVQVADEGLLRLTAPALPDGRYDVTVRNPDGATATLWSGLIAGSGGTTVTGTREGCRAVTVYFALDQAGLTDEGVRELAEAAPCWLGAQVKVQIDGHADARGTTDYNLALGARRADSVRKELNRLGMPLHTMRTMSYGEERPAATGTDEDAYARNRRVEVQAVR